MKIGVLAVQGDFAAHQAMLERLGVEVVLVRKQAELESVEGLVIPGGESSTILKLLGNKGFAALGEFVRTRPVFGTCAGCILLAKEVTHPKQASLGVLDIAVARNAYGRQIDSAILTAETKLAGGPLEQVYIRAPRIERAGPAVEVLATRDEHPVLVRQGRAMAATFHPEMTPDLRVHAEFLKLVR